MAQGEQENKEHLIKLDLQSQYQDSRLSRLENVVEKVVEASRAQAHTVDKLLEDNVLNKSVDTRLRRLEENFEKGVFLWKIAFGIVSTPSVVAILYLVFKYLVVLNA